MGEGKKTPQELDDKEVESVSGGRWKSVQDTTDDPDATSSGKGKTK